MKISRLIILLLPLIFSIGCQKESSPLHSQYPFVQKLDKSLKAYDYVSVVNEAADSLRLNPNLNPELKKEIYLRYAIAVAMRNYGNVHYSIMDSLQAYRVDSLYTRINQDLIQKSSEVYAKARAKYQSRDYNEALKLTREAYQIYPGQDEAHALEDSINLIINQSKAQ